MSPPGRVLAVLLVTFMLTLTGSALKCFDCTSSEDGRCRDYFDQSQHTLKDCERERHSHIDMEPFCKKLIYSVDQNMRQNETMRSCAWASKEDTGSICKESLPNYSNHLLHCSICDTDNCNGTPGTALVSVTSCLLPALLTGLLQTV